MTDSGLGEDEPLRALSQDDREVILQAVERWAGRRSPQEPLLAFLDGSIATAHDLVRALELKPPLVKFGKQWPRRRTSAGSERVRRHILNLFAVELRRSTLSSLINDFRREPPPAGDART